MLDRVTTASLVLAAVPALGASHAAICRETGLGKGAVDAALLGLLRGRCLVRMPDGRYMRPECVKRDTEVVLAKDANGSRTRTPDEWAEMARKAAKVRSERRAAGETLTKRELRARASAERLVKWGAHYREILRLHREGRTTREVATALGLTYYQCRQRRGTALKWEALGRLG